MGALAADLRPLIQLIKNASLGFTHSSCDNSACSWTSANPKSCTGYYLHGGPSEGLWVAPCLLVVFNPLEVLQETMSHPVFKVPFSKVFTFLLPFCFGIIAVAYDDMVGLS